MTSTPDQNIAKDVQGDIVLRLPKTHEAFLFFSIEHADDFKRALRNGLIDRITTTADVAADEQKIARARASLPGVFLDGIQGLNVSFSSTGLNKLGVNVDEAFRADDVAFKAGQEADGTESLGDPMDVAGKLTTWKSEFKGRRIDGVFLLTASNKVVLDGAAFRTLVHLGNSIRLIVRKDGVVRPGIERGHEHFGFLDGITRPTIRGFNDSTRPEGESVAPPEVFLLRPDPKDENKKWTVNGSFLAFRELQQEVPEFQRFTIEAAAESQPGQPVEPKLFALIGARMVGRWKSGVPIVHSPVDEPQNVTPGDILKPFDFSDDLEQVRCPYAAHIRKSHPRKGTFPEDRITTIDHLILRSGIAYGPEVTDEEKRVGETKEERGLLFVSYQASLEKGFQFIQKNWLNNVAFPFNNAARIAQPGHDLIVGQNEAAESDQRTTQGIKPGRPEEQTNLVSAPPFVVPRGGEYFFTPSIPGLRHLANLSTSTSAVEMIRKGLARL
ncbi:hypothetical protein JCM6882_001515 [Rhodosporidiobolus microsporus]